MADDYEQLLPVYVGNDRGDLIRRYQVKLTEMAEGDVQAGRMADVIIA
jgi:hypothetical protein